MINLLDIKKIFILIGSLAFLSTNTIAKTNNIDESISKFDNNFENLYKLDEKENTKNKDAINKEIKTLRTNINSWGRDEIPKRDIILMDKIKSLLIDYGDPQGFCPLSKNTINRNEERKISEYLIEIVKPIYTLPREQKLNLYGQNNLWIPSLDTISNKLVKEEIELLKKLKPVYGYLYGDNEDIYQGPISTEAALLINDLIDRVLFKIDYVSNITNIEKANLKAIKAANFFWPLGRVSDSIEEYKEAINFLESDKPSEIINSALAHLYGSLAYMYASNGNYPKMLDSVDKAYISFSKLKILDIQALIETSLINYWWGFGNEKVDYNLLNTIYLEYLGIIGGKESSTYLWQEYAFLYYAGDILPLNKRYQISKSIVKRMKNCSRGYDLAEMLRQKALIEYEMGDYEVALKTAEESLSEYVYGNGWINNSTASLLGYIADIKIALGEYKEALQILNKEIDIFKELGFKNLYNPTDSENEKSAISKIYAICSVKQLDACFDKPGEKQLKELIDYLNKSFIYLSDEDRLNLFEFIKKDIVYRSYQNQNLLDQHLSFWLTTKGILADIEKSTQVLLKTNKNNQNDINKIKEITNQLSDLSLERTLRLKLIDDKRDLERDLYRKIPQTNLSIYNLDDINKVLPKKSVLIEFKKYVPFDITNKNNKEEKERYLAFLIKDNDFIKYDLGEAKYIDDKIKSALKSTEEGLKDSEEKWLEVRDLIIKPMIQKLNKNDILFISPDGLLNIVPFTALPGRRLVGKSYLSDEYDVRLISTARDLIQLSNPLPKNSNYSLVVANPTFEFKRKNKEINLLDEMKTYNKLSKDFSNQNKEWKLLPYSEYEGKEISKILNSKLLRGKDATPEAIKNISNPKILHLASHYDFLEGNSNIENLNNPLLNGFIPLAGANNLIKDKKNNGYLSALEIAGMDLNNTELVVISACGSGIGDNYLGGLNFGLKRAITLAGARSSLLSLWKVDDNIASAFMISFYKNLVSGMSRSKALLETQTEFRKSSNPYYRHISAWGAFQLSGDWRKIDL